MGTKRSWNLGRKRNEGVGNARREVGGGVGKYTSVHS